MKRIESYKYLLLIGDIVLINAGYFMTFVLQYGFTIFDATSPIYLSDYAIAFFVFSWILPVLFQYKNMYKLHVILGGREHFLALLLSLTKGYIFFAIIAFFFKHNLVIQRMTVGLSFFVLLSMNALYRCVLLPALIRRLSKLGRFGKRVILVGAGEKGRKLARHFKNGNSTYFKVVGFLDDNEELIGNRVENITVFGPISKAKEVADNLLANEFLISINAITHEKLLSIIEICKASERPVHVTSILYKVIPEKLEVERFDSVSTFCVKTPSSRLLYIITKRIVDFSLALGILLCLSPLLGLLSLLIKISSKGPLIYRKGVVGKNEKEFTFYKFRTMYHNNDDSTHRKYVSEFIKGNGKNNGNDKKKIYKIKDDPRITKVGKFLRRFSLDELPQLVNVLKGDMSLVGPRPCAVDEFKYYSPWHKERFKITPGITGLYQVTARSSVSYDDMVVLDLYYKENKSLWLDIEIMAKTIPTMLFGKGAY